MTDESPESTKLPRRFRLTVAYDGRPWTGWQSQVGGDTVQDQLLAALQTIHPEITTVQGSGRTDAGVSAIGQVAHFDVSADASLDAGAWLRALNTRLPTSIRIMGSAEVTPDFHARFSARAKTYRYRLWTGPVLPPLEAGVAWHVPRLGDRVTLSEALNAFVGRHDFRAFSANRGDGKDADRDTERELFEISTQEGDDWLEITYTGNGFLYKMVRFLTGSAVRAAQGKLEVSGINALLKGVSGSEKAPYCAPADGLMLIEVLYPESA
ncbi:MAG: tRNA pseudouridine(38-40) synthase TruA [Verrucomicrobiae bacterium]|nr:tRNA pseudouridine(38-40) synthase TruA [Verrucomicrobiae bacterium]